MIAVHETYTVQEISLRAGVLLSVKLSLLVLAREVW